MTSTQSARTKLSTLKHRLGIPGEVHMVRRTVNAGASNVYDVIDFKADDGCVLFSVDPNDLFDDGGNFFEDDL